MTSYLLFSAKKQKFLRGAKFWRWTRFQMFAAKFPDREAWDLYLDKDYLVGTRPVIATVSDGVCIDIEWSPPQRGLATIGEPGGPSK